MFDFRGETPDYPGKVLFFLNPDFMKIIQNHTASLKAQTPLSYGFMGKRVEFQTQPTLGGGRKEILLSADRILVQTRHTDAIKARAACATVVGSPELLDKPCLGPRPSLRTRVGRHREAEGLRRLLRHRQLRRNGKPLRHEGHPRSRAPTMQVVCSSRTQTPS